jgi:hypothetical protein
MAPIRQIVMADVQTRLFANTLIQLTPILVARDAFRHVNINLYKHEYMI